MIPGGSQGNVNRKFACDQNDHRSKNRILYRQARAAIGLIVATSPQSDLANCRSGYDYPDVQFSLQTGKSSLPKFNFGYKVVYQDNRITTKLESRGNLDALNSRRNNCRRAVAQEPYSRTRGVRAGIPGGPHHGRA